MSTPPCNCNAYGLLDIQKKSENIVNELNHPTYKIETHDVGVDQVHD